MGGSGASPGCFCAAHHEDRRPASSNATIQRAGQHPGPSPFACPAEEDLRQGKEPSGPGAKRRTTADVTKSALIPLMKAPIRERLTSTPETPGVRDKLSFYFVIVPVIRYLPFTRLRLPLSRILFGPKQCGSPSHRERCVTLALRNSRPLGCSFGLLYGTRIGR